MVNYIADGIDHNQRCHDYVIADFAASRAQTALSSPFNAQDFSHRSAGAGADAALRHFLFRGSQASLVTLLNAGPDIAAADIQVEENGCRNNRHLGYHSFVTDTFFLEIYHHSSRGVETESATAAEKYSMNFFHQAHWSQQVSFSRS